MFSKLQRSSLCGLGDNSSKEREFNKGENYWASGGFHEVARGVSGLVRETIALDRRWHDNF